MLDVFDLVPGDPGVHAGVQGRMRALDVNSGTGDVVKLENWVTFILKEF